MIRDLAFDHLTRPEGRNIYIYRAVHTIVLNETMGGIFQPTHGERLHGTPKKDRGNSI